MAEVRSLPHAISASSACPRENPISHSCWRDRGSTLGWTGGGGGGGGRPAAAAVEEPALVLSDWPLCDACLVLEVAAVLALKNSASLVSMSFSLLYRCLTVAMSNSTTLGFSLGSWGEFHSSTRQGNTA